MSVAARFVLPLLVVLAILTGVSSRAIERITDGWVERDLSTRAELVVSSGRDSLLPAWQSSDKAHIQRFLNNLLHDERIVGAAACDTKEHPIATTPKFPAPLTCDRLGRDLWRHGPTAAPGATHSWFGAVPIYGQEVHVSVVPLFDDAGEPLGFVVLVHDLRFEEQRRTTIQRILLFAFATLTAVASLLTAIVARLSWHNWLRYVRRLLRGDKRAAEEATARPEFSPIAQDVRELIARIGDDERSGPRGAWTPDRLREILRRELVGEKVIIVANREPYIHEHVPRKTNDGGTDAGGHRDSDIAVRFPASGLVTALEPVMRACSGVWIAHGSGSADRETVDANGRVRVPPGEEAYTLRRVWLSPEEEQGYYYGFSNEGLWPLCHFAHTRPIFRAEDWAHYQAGQPEVRRRGLRRGRHRRSDRPRAGLPLRAGAAADPAASAARDDPDVLAHPLAQRRALRHLPLAQPDPGGHARQQHPRLSHAAALQQLHRRGRSLYRGAHRSRRPGGGSRGADDRWCAPIRSRSSGPSAGCRRCRRSPECRRSVIAELGLHDDALIGVGVDRLDYTKGIEERLLAVEALLEHHPELRGRFTFVQLAAPSRTEIPRYHELDREVEALAARINERFGTKATAGAAIDRSSCCARTTSRRRCSATTAPRISAT